MALIIAALAALPPTRELLSGITGSISLAAWVFLLVPQMLENYTKQSAEGVSLAFLCVWFIGDVTSLIGAVWAGLVPTVIALAVYFCFADTIMIAQCLYYNHLNARLDEVFDGIAEENGGEPTEETSLLRRSSRSSRRSRRRSSAASRSILASDHSLPLQSVSRRRQFFLAFGKNILGVAGVCAVGTLGWFVAWKMHWWMPQDDRPEDDGKAALGAVFLGYFSAVCYLCARIPQIMKNFRDKSCDGLSLLFFILSLLGNLTYGLGILFHSTNDEYLVVNAPWLIGSLGTMLEDVLIFAQFYIYSRENDDDDEATS